MRTLPVENLESNTESGPLTADGLLRRRAWQRPGAVALIDPPNVAGLGLGTPRALTYRELDAAVDRMAAFFAGLGLVPGDIVAAQLPNLSMGPLTLLAAWRAGLTVAMLPLLWREREIGMACEAVSPKALIGVARFDGDRNAERLCSVAAAQLSVRFVLGFGSDLPDGAVSLGDVIAADGPEPRSPAVSDAERGPAVINFTARAGQSRSSAARRSFWRKGR